MYAEGKCDKMYKGINRSVKECDKDRNTQKTHLEHRQEGKRAQNPEPAVVNLNGRDTCGGTQRIPLPIQVWGRHSPISQVRCAPPTGRGGGGEVRVGVEENAIHIVP